MRGVLVRRLKLYSVKGACIRVGHHGMCSGSPDSTRWLRISLEGQLLAFGQIGPRMQGRVMVASADRASNNGLRACAARMTELYASKA